jgi:hypothetical protein
LGEFRSSLPRHCHRSGIRQLGWVLGWGSSDHHCLSTVTDLGSGSSVGKLSWELGRGSSDHHCLGAVTDLGLGSSVGKLSWELGWGSSDHHCLGAVTDLESGSSAGKLSWELGVGLGEFRVSLACSDDTSVPLPSPATCFIAGLHPMTHLSPHSTSLPAKRRLDTLQVNHTKTGSIIQNLALHAIRKSPAHHHTSGIPRLPRRCGTFRSTRQSKTTPRLAAHQAQPQPCTEIMPGS